MSALTSSLADKPGREARLLREQSARDTIRARGRHSVGCEPSHDVHKQVNAVLFSFDMASSADLVLGLAGELSAARADCSFPCATPPNCSAGSLLLCCQCLPLPWQAPHLPCLSVHQLSLFLAGLPATDRGLSSCNRIWFLTRSIWWVEATKSPEEQQSQGLLKLDRKVKL